MDHDALDTFRKRHLHCVTWQEVQKSYLRSPEYIQDEDNPRLFRNIVTGKVREVKGECDNEKDGYCGFNPPPEVLARFAPRSVGRPRKHEKEPEPLEVEQPVSEAPEPSEPATEAPPRRRGRRRREVIPAPPVEKSTSSSIMEEHKRNLERFKQNLGLE